MQYLFPSRNLLSAAVGYIVQAGSINTRTAATKRGGGMVSLGQDTTDCTIDVEIQNNTIVGTPTVSAPVFRGVGNGTLTSVSASSGLAAQVFTVTLVDLGTDSRKAFIPFQGVTLRAKTAGAGGNDIAITIDQTGITRTGTNESLLSPLVENQNEYVGEEWDFGAPVLNPDRTIPTTAPRLSFGDDPQVYRQYKEFLDGRYVYRFSPAPVRGVAAGARVKAVTGSRSVEFDDGVTTRTYSSVTTLYSLLTQIQADTSALVDIDGPVVLDTTQNGMAITDLSIRSGAFIQAIERDGTVYARDADITITAAHDAPTELLTVRCKDASLTGAEIWDVRGAVSGQLQDAVTAVAYADGAYGFTIPEQLPPATAPQGERSARLELLGVDSPSGDGEGGTGTREGGLPSLCVENFVLGADASPRTFTFIWRQRRNECSCNGVDINGGPDGDILGVDVTGEATMGDLIPAALQTRLETLYEWQSTFVSSQIELATAHPAPGYLLDTDAGDSSTPFVTQGGVATASAEYNDGTLIHGYIIKRMSAILKADKLDIEAAKQTVSVFVSAIYNAYNSIADHVIPTTALTEFDAAVTDMQADFTEIADVAGAEAWRKWGSQWSGLANDQSAFWSLLTQNAGQLYTTEVGVFLERYRARMAYFLTLAGVQPDFDGAGLGGNPIWQDHGERYWFESQDGLLPLQPGWYYHSAKLSADGEPVSTREFGIGVGIACIDQMRRGDKLVLTISGSGNVRATYQVGDTFTARVIAGGPLELGGGQSGDDTLVFRVRGSSAGVLADYDVYKPSPAAYSDSGLGFLITPGGIPHALGDEWTFYTEGGQFKYRVNGGSWSTGHQIANSVTHGGHMFLFTPGQAPSWVIGDSYSFRVQALNTLARLVSPAQGGITTSANTLTVDYTTGMEDGSAKTVLACRVPITESVPLTVTVRNSSNVAIETHSFTAEPGDNAWDLTALLVNGTGTGDTVRVAIGAPATLTAKLDWLFLGEPFEFTMGPDQIEHGELTRQVTLATASRRARRLGGSVVHSAVTDESVDDFLELADDAQSSSSGCFGVVLNGAKRWESGIVRIAGDPVIESEDLFQFQPTDPDQRRHTVSLSFEPA